MSTNPTLLTDDLGYPIALPEPPQRIVSLVPSLTEALASCVPQALVGATDWCTHPGELAVTRVRGTKNPDRQAILRLQPDLVVANREENREIDVRRLREAGITVWVTDIETVPQALESLTGLLAAVGGGAPEWLAQARELWSAPGGARRAGRRADLARPVDGRRRAHVHRGPAGPSRPHECARRP